MTFLRPSLFATAIAAATLASSPAAADPFAFNTGPVNGLMAMASRPAGAGTSEIETADDFVLTDTTRITSASFTGLLLAGTAAPNVTSIVIEIYRVFPFDSDTGRTPAGPTRANSPSDVAFDSRDSGASDLSFATSVLATNFTALNSVQPGGIHPSPNQTTGGNGAVSGAETLFSINLSNALVLPAGHYFFVPQVGVSNGGTFMWLSASRPIVAPGTPFAPDLQAWTRDDKLDPDWLRVGTDIVGGTTPPTFNAAFSLGGELVASVPEPSSYAMLLAGLGVVGLARARRRQRELH